MDNIIRNDIIYSIQISIKKEIEPTWIEYMKKHIGEVVNSVNFRDFNVRKVITSEFNENLTPQDNDHTTTYVIDYKANHRGHLRRYFDSFAETLKKEHVEKFGGQFTASRIILEDQFKEWYPRQDLGDKVAWSDSSALKY